MAWRRSLPARPRGALAAALWAAVLACAVNPVTGQRELVLMSPAEEASVGRQAAEQVEAEIGLVDDPALTAYVQEIGERLARHSPRADVAYHFAVADMPEPNAFALPGGYIYVSRGLLAIANSEAELANVIGHEIGHVAARHAAQRQTRAAGVGILSALGTVAAGVLGGGGAAAAASQLGQVAGAGLIASYGRDQERQADEVGQRIAADASYDPAAMASFLRTLERETRLRSDGAERRPSFFDSHPLTAERVEATATRAAGLQAAPGSALAGSREAFYARLDGLLVGENPAGGVFRDARFVHPGLDFAMEFPAGWQTQNGATAVAAQAPGGDAVLVLEAQGASGDPEAAATRFAQANGVALEDARRLRIGGYDAVRAFALASTQQGPVVLHLTWIEHPSALFRLTGLAPQSRFAASRGRFDATAASFRGLSRGDREGLSETRLRVVRARAGETLQGLARRTGNVWNDTETAVANALAEGEALREGQPVKIAVRVPYAP